MFMHFHAIEQFIRSWALNAMGGYILTVTSKWIRDRIKVGAAVLALAITDKLFAILFPEEMMRYLRIAGLVLVSAAAVGVSLGSVRMLRSTR
jgi:hypothetical protein